MASEWPVSCVTCLRRTSFSYIDDTENRKSYSFLLHDLHCVRDSLLCYFAMSLCWWLNYKVSWLLLCCEFREVLNVVLPLGKSLYTSSRLLKWAPKSTRCISLYKYIFFAFNNPYHTLIHLYKCSNLRKYILTCCLPYALQNSICFYKFVKNVSKIKPKSGAIFSFSKTYARHRGCNKKNGIIRVYIGRDK